MTPEEQYSEIPAIEQLQSLGYTYFKAKDLPSNERAATQEVLLKNQLKTAIARLNPWMNDHAQRKAFQKITQVDGNSLMEINEQIWHLLRGNTFNLADEQGNFHPVRYIDYTEIDQNEFWLIQQMSFKNNAGRLSIPDLLLYVNGLPLVVIECKSPNISAPWDEAYSELTAYQDLNPELFHYNQFCVGIWQTGGRYGAIEAPQKFYSVFKQKNAEGMKQQAILIANLLAKERLLDILRHFIIFETDEGRTLKKLPRYQQLRATNRAIRKLQKGKGGVIWHTQGSGKSITMVYLTRKLQAPEYGFKNPTVLVLTDRTDLDTQITNTFLNIGFKNIYHADSVVGLELLLQNDYGGIITSTVQKFQEQEEQDEKSKAKKKGRWGRKKAKQKEEKATPKAGDKRVQKKLHDGKLLKITQILQENGKWQESEREEIELKELSQKENLYVLVDEAHRSQYGFLAAFMRSVIPKAKFVAFTGTPISKKDKSTLNEFYGGDYIDVYTIKESVADGATVELLYDQGIALLKVKKKKLDKKFKKKFGKASKAKQDKLKRAALKKYALSKKRMKAISQHIIEHFRDKIRPDHHKAMLVCQGRPMAIRYQKIFTQLRAEGFHDFESKAVMSLGSVKKDKIAKELYQNIEWNKKHPTEEAKPLYAVPSEDIKTVVEDFKLPYGDETDVAKSGKKQYNNTAFLIVSDMLLTGYDAPIASCLYLDKPLKEHNLLQAIARVNRSRTGKNAGFIMDYYGIGGYLIKALEIFSGDLERKDLLKNLSEEIPTLQSNHTKLVDFFKNLGINRKYAREEYIEAAILYLEPLDKRDHFKDLLKDFNQSINIVLPDRAALVLKPDFLLFNEIKFKARSFYKEDEGLKITDDESQMLQTLIDEHLKSQGIKSILEEPISIIDKDKFAETLQNASPDSKELKMRNNLKYTIKVGLEKNPDFFRPLAERLERLLKEREAGRLKQLDLLKAFGGIQDAMANEQKENEKKGFVTLRQIAVYSSLKVLLGNGDAAEKTTHAVFDAIEGELNVVGWIDNNRVCHNMEKKIRKVLRASGVESEVKKKAQALLDLIKRNS